MGRNKIVKIGLYPGSFNPWHVGHQDILNKSLKIFDEVVVLACSNPEKNNSPEVVQARSRELKASLSEYKKVAVHSWSGTIKSYLYQMREKNSVIFDGFIRGLRNGQDLEYEIAQMCLHEDTGMDLPFICFLTDRKYSHVSSSAIRALDKLGLKHGYTSSVNNTTCI